MFFTDKLLFTFMFDANLKGQVLRGGGASPACTVDLTQELCSYFWGQIRDHPAALESVDNINTEQTLSLSKEGLRRKIKTACQFKR